jgi:hypothetical protein
MKLDNIKHSAERINTLVEGWKNSGSIPRIERDLALDELRRIYDQLLDIESGEESNIEPVAPVAAAPVVAVAQVSESVADTPNTEVNEVVNEASKAENSADVNTATDGDDDVIDIDALLGLSVPVAAATVTATTTVAEAAATTVAPKAEPLVESPVVSELNIAEEQESHIVEEEAIEPMSEAAVADVPATDAMATPGALFAVEDIPVAKRGGRTMISLYNVAGRTASSVVDAAVDDDTPTTPPVVSEEPQTMRLADVLGGGKQVLAEKMAAEEKPTTPFNRVTDLRKAIGINDKFLMIKDLFGGNAAQYEATIDVLNEFDDLDDCMIYIVENFSWNPDSEGAKLLVSLIERKLS